MSLYVVRPISTWPGERRRFHSRAPFRTQWSLTLDLLGRELRMLNAQRVVLEIDVREIDLRNDGELRANARPASPAVVLSFKSKHGPLRYPCDRFSGWQDNVRAIALALEALRKVDRYGVTAHGEQYRGWRALPATTGPTMTATRAAELLAKHAYPSDRPDGHVPNALRAAGAARRMALAAVKHTHPDAGGDREAFEAVQTARRVLTAHFGEAV